MYLNRKLWRMDPILGKDLETNNETRAAAIQHASTTIATVRNGIFYSVRAKW
jgi:hypothetical protein